MHTLLPVSIAFLISAAIALAARRARSLSWSGAVAATVVGAAALHASTGWGVYLILWFVLATALSKVGKQAKATRVANIGDKGGSRDAVQVLANGGVFGAASLFVIFFTGSCDLTTACGRTLAVAAAGSLAAAGADTWATEIGTMWGGTPWSLRTAACVPAGTSGAITAAGSVALATGAITLALLAAVCGVVAWQARPVIAVGFGGIAGAVADSILGAWLQERLWCSTCAMETEQTVHRCGTVSTHHRGVRGLNNDAVNALCSIVGAVGATVLVLP